MREIVLDTETTGLDPAAGHRLVAVGCVELVDKVPTGGQFYQLLNPEREVPKEAADIHGLTDEVLAGEPLFQDIAASLLNFIADSRLVIHNAEFDMGFLNAELTRIGHQKIPLQHATDTLILARRKFPGADNRLDGLCTRFGIDNSDRHYHGALRDAILLSEVYLDLTDSRRQVLDLAGADVLREHNTGPASARPEPLAALLTSAERERHRDRMAKLGEDAVWNRYLDRNA